MKLYINTIFTLLKIARSNYFEAIFQGQLREANQKMITLKSFCEFEVPIQCQYFLYKVKLI